MRITETAPREGTTGDLVSKGVAQLVRGRPELVLLAHEQWALAVRDPGTRPAYLARQALLREALATTLRARHETTGVPLTFPAEQLATAVLALANGLAAEALVDPEAVPDELLGDMLALLYDGLAARAER
jgi:hypothetical protein